MDTHTVSGGDDTELHVDVAGPDDAPPVVLVHGYSQSRLSWYKQFDSDLTEEFRLVAPDLRGHGDSEKPDGTDAYHDPTLWAADVQAVVDEFARDRAVFVGWSYGGLILSDYLSVEGTDDVAGVNLVGAISEKGTDTAAAVAGDAFAAMLSDLETRDAEASVAALGDFLDICVAGPLSAHDRYFMLGFNAACPPRVREALQSRRADHEDTLRTLDVPVLLTHGTADRVVLPTATENHAALVPDAERSLYEGVGHSPFWEAPERFNRELREFVVRC
ncbi:alpha/beta hydrolase [Salinigranum rubrum]|uniref:Alpha/beta hydrolase n=1 Tax=Salinigranum rubrum TaxID=755307 RepID=A0A2I8VHV4_9EURY|nr:alpha/beta hydrolase [Salinigranum rubrum]AUV80629.1 alpha/beta hydrolase [Salinigranum rubrum]